MVALVVGLLVLSSIYPLVVGAYGLVRRGGAVGYHGGRLPRRDIAAVICAHNEAKVIVASVASASRAGFAPVVVLADRCTDGTDALARGAGAVVWSVDGGRLGKAKLLEEYLPEVLNVFKVDAVAVVDADNVVERAFWTDACVALDRGFMVSQARLRTLNANDGFWPAAIGASYEWSHWGSQVARCGWGAVALGGTGMVFSRKALERLPFHAETFTDDLEYTMRWRLMGGKVAVLEGAVLDEKPRTLASVLRQRWRWMTGHLGCARRFTVPLAKVGAWDHVWLLWNPLLMVLSQVFGLLVLWFSPLSFLTVFVTGGLLNGWAWLKSRWSDVGVIPPWWSVWLVYPYSWIWLPAIVGAYVWPATRWNRTEHLGVRS